MEGSAPAQGYTSVPQGDVVVTQPAEGVYPSLGVQPGYGPSPAAGYAPVPPGAPAGPMLGAGQLFPLLLMPPPAPISGMPPGLEYLAHLDCLRIHQQVEVVDMVSPVETPNRYQVKNSQGQLVYTVIEESNACQRMWCSDSRGFIFHVLNNYQQEVVRITREYSCCGACCACGAGCVTCDCCSPTVCVEAPAGNVVGYVREQCGCFAPSFAVQDANKREVLTVDGGYCSWYCCYRSCGQSEFEISLGDGSHRIGKISKLWSGCMKDLVTTMDHYGLSFPMNLDVQTKAVLLGAAILIDFKFYHQPKKVPRKGQK